MYRVPSLPVSVIKNDIQTMKEIGFNTVKVQLSWSITEKRESEIDIEEVEGIVSHAQNLGMGVFLGVTMEQAPMWLWRKYPDSRMINAAGQVHEDPTQYLLPADGKPGPCHDHPGVQQAIRNYLSTVVNRLAKYENIVVWNIWQEIGFRERPGAATLSEQTYCYCDNTLGNFRAWLRDKYSSLDDLNQTWQTGFGEWDEVEPPRMFMMVPSWIDWRYFINMVSVPAALARRYESVTGNDPLRRPVMAHEDVPVLGSGRSRAYLDVLDISGTSFYPDWATVVEPWDYGFTDTDIHQRRKTNLNCEMFRSSLHFDYVRSAGIGNAGKEFWAAEFQSGPTINDGLYVGAEPEVDDVNRWLMLALSCGVQGICFWNHRPEIFWSEMHGFGLCDWNGRPTEYAEAAGRIGRSINEHRDLFKMGHVPQAPVAIIVGEDLHNFTEATGELQKHLRHTIKGWYQTLWEEGIPVDFLEEAQVSERSLESYKVAILPFAVALGNELAQSLASYVERGGVLVTEACPGRVSRYGLANHGGIDPSMRDLFGIQLERLRLVEETGGEKWIPGETSLRGILDPAVLVGKEEYEGLSIKANLYIETFVLEDDRQETGNLKPILSYGKETAGIESNRGKGVAYLLGTLVGHGIASYAHGGTREFILRLVREAGVHPERLGKLLLRRRVLGKKEAWFLMNNSDEIVTEDIDTTDLLSVEDLVEDQTLSIDSGTAAITVKPFSIRCLIVDR